MDGPVCVLITQECNVTSLIKVIPVVLEEANVFIHVCTLEQDLGSSFEQAWIKLSGNWPSYYCDKNVFNILFPCCSYCLSLETKRGPLNKI